MVTLPRPLKVPDPAACAFYEIEAEHQNWSVLHLERQIFTALHLRLLKSRDKAGVMELARKGQSHIKPWADCETDAERLDVYNGILLAPHLDAAFDHGFVTVADDGAILVSDTLDAAARATLGLDRALRVRGLTDGHCAYLAWHRDHVFQKGAM